MSTTEKYGVKRLTRAHLQRARIADIIREAMAVDRARAPRAAEYLHSLPNGLQSFPACTIREDVFEQYVREFSGLAKEPGLPKPVADLLSGGFNGKGWAPEVVFQTAHLVVRDLGFPNDKAFHQWMYDLNQALFDKPLTRAFMRLLSPTLVLLGSSKRWTTFHRGSELVPGPVQEIDGRVHTVATLKYPELLFPKLFLEGLEQIFLAAISGARGTDVRVALGTVSPGSAEYRISFR